LPARENLHVTSTDKPTNSQSALDALPFIPRDEDGPVFKEPWEAEVFAMTLSLHQQGMFTWSEWAALLSESIHNAQIMGDPDLGNTYYRHWLDALEHMVVQAHIGSRQQLADLYANWDEAARSTPHGQPIELS
jgi:nitrile hydratase accessory protein